MEIPSTHTVPLSWLYEAASLPIQYRTLTEVVPEPARDFERVATLRDELLHYKEALAIVRKQKDTGLWGGNLLAPAASKSMGWKEVGTIFQYRRLLELGWPADSRPFRFADRFLFRLLSRDDDPTLLVEFQRPAKGDPGLGLWVRSMGAQGAAAALARGAHQDDPRLRGAAHRVASDISMYLRSDLAQKPFRKARGKTVLDPLTYPPTVFSIEVLAFMPAVQRERAGFLERLAGWSSSPGSGSSGRCRLRLRFWPGSTANATTRASGAPRDSASCPNQPMRWYRITSRSRGPGRVRPSDRPTLRSASR